MKNFFFIALIVLFFSCKSDSGRKENLPGDATQKIDTSSLKKTSVSDPDSDTFIIHPTGYRNTFTFLDSTINVIKLNDCDAIIKLFGDKYELLPEIEDLPSIQIFSKDKSQLLTMYMFNGSTKCDFSQFRVEYISRNSKYLQEPYSLDVDVFKSGKGIYLGMTSEQLISQFGIANE